MMVDNIQDVGGKGYCRGYVGSWEVYGDCDSGLVVGSI